MFKRLLFLIPVAFFLAACGSGGDDHTPSIGDPTTPPPTEPPPTGPTIGAITVQTSSPQIASNGSATAEITAYVRGTNNQFLEAVDVTFSSTSGGMTVSQGTTDAGGIARATLNPAGDPSNRSITVTVAAGDMTGTVVVDVVGTQLSVSGPASLAQNDVGNYVVSLVDSGGTGISGREITLSSSLSNTLSANSVTTNSAGQATFTMTAANGGADTISASGLGLTTTHATTVSIDQFAFVLPAENAEIALNTPQDVTVQWTQAGNVPQVGRVLTFASTRGTLSSSTATTNANGEATVSIQSSNAGFGTLSVSGDGGITSQRTIEFVASTPATIEVQASPFTIATQESSTITAVVRDAANNPVKNQTVLFSLTDVTGGQLSVASALTDSQGRAQSTYTAGSGTSATGGVEITASVQGAAVTPDVASITVGRREVFISLGTGNEIDEPNTAQYAIEYAVQVTDASGTGVANTALTLEILSVDYRKGERTWVAPTWQTPSNILCVDEDVDRDGILDAGEDLNGSTRIEAGNIATVTPRNVTTDADGFAIVRVVYPQEYAYWLNARLSATTAVQGSEFARSVTFLLPGLASDFNSQTTSPPGVVSPFGTQVCGNPN